MGKIETEFDRCKVEGCSYPKGECVVIKKAQDLAKSDNFTLRDWIVAKNFLFNKLDKCVKKNEAKRELESISPLTFLKKKEKIG